MVNLLRDATTRRRLAALRAAVAASGHSGGGKNAARPVRQHAQKQLHRRLDDALDFGRNVRDLDDEKQHQLRIACKQLRYACDFFSGLYEGQLQEIVKPITRLQDLLGAAHDAVVFAARLEDIRRGLPARGDRQALEVVQHDLHRRKKTAQSKAAGLWMEFTTPANIRKLRRLINQGRG
jgi:CHAD domain-containing protein